MKCGSRSSMGTCISRGIRLKPRTGIVPSVGSSYSISRNAISSWSRLTPQPWKRTFRSSVNAMSSAMVGRPAMLTICLAGVLPCSSAWFTGTGLHLSHQRARKRVSSSRCVKAMPSGWLAIAASHHGPLLSAKPVARSSWHGSVHGALQSIWPTCPWRIWMPTWRTKRSRYGARPALTSPVASEISD